MIRRQLAVSLVLAALTSCAPKEDSRSSKRIDELNAKVENLSGRLGQLEKDLAPVLQAVKQNQAQQAEEAKQPDPNVVYAVPVGNSPVQGPADAKVTMVQAFEFACPFCFKVRPTVTQLEQDYKGNLRVVSKYFLIHEQAVPAGLAMCAATHQGKFDKLEPLIWTKGFEKQDLSPANMTKLAKEAGLDMKKFDADVNGEDCRKELQANQEMLTKFGVRGTPAFFINGRYLSGALPPEVFKKVIDEELAKADKAIAAGEATKADYYEKMVIAKGKPEVVWTTPAQGK